MNFEMMMIFAALIVSQYVGIADAVVAQDTDNGCHCYTELTLNIPSCCSKADTCSEAEQEANRLRQDLKELRSNCSSQEPSLASTYNFPHVTVEGVRWTRFWWYTPINGFPTSETDVLGAPYGACDENAAHCFARLPGALEEADAEMLAIDSSGTIYRWQFDPSNPTAHAAWNAFYHHREQRIGNSRTWNPQVIAGPQPNVDQDSFMYRVQNGVRSLQLDDDNCDCLTTLNIGHGMCNDGFSTSYGPANRFGVDLLYDTYCQTPDPKHGLALYFRDDNDCASNPCPQDQECVDHVNRYACVSEHNCNCV